MASNGKPPKKSPSFERLDACIRNLQDRHDYWHSITRTPATREAAMAGIVGELQAGVLLPGEEIDIRCLTIFALAGISIKKGTPKEARLAYRAVGLLLLTLRDGTSGPLLDEALPVLSKVIRTHAAHDDAPTVVAAIDCLACASFAGPRRAEAAMKAVWRAVVPPLTSRRSAKMKAQEGPKTCPVVVAAAVSAWAFLLTTVVSTTNTQRRKKADRGSWSAAVVYLVEMLDADDRRVRLAAGEALVVCVELDLVSGKDMDTLAAKVSELAGECASKGANNTLLHEQKELFGKIEAFLDHDERPEILVRRSGERQDVIKVSTWVRLVQLNFLRRFLGNGFMKHAEGNPVLKEAFRFGRVEGKPLSIQEEDGGLDIYYDHDFVWDLIQKNDWSRTWVCDNFFCLSGELLQLGWH